MTNAAIAELCRSVFWAKVDDSKLLATDELQHVLVHQFVLGGFAPMENDASFGWNQVPALMFSLYVLEFDWNQKAWFLLLCYQWW